MLDKLSTAFDLFIGWTVLIALVGTLCLGVYEIGGAVLDYARPVCECECEVDKTEPAMAEWNYVDVQKQDTR